MNHFRTFACEQGRFIGFIWRRTAAQLTFAQSESELQSQCLWFCLIWHPISPSAKRIPLAWPLSTFYFMILRLVKFIKLNNADQYISFPLKTILTFLLYSAP